jgi:hypothetical protein
VGVARSRDHHGVNIRAREQLLVTPVPALDAQRLRQPLCPRGVGVGDTHEMRAG